MPPPQGSRSQRCNKAVYCGVHAAGDAYQAPAGARGTEGQALTRVTGVGSGEEFSFNNRALSGPHNSAGLIMAYSGKLFVGSTVKNPSAGPLISPHPCCVLLLNHGSTQGWLWVHPGGVHVFDDRCVRVRRQLTATGSRQRHSGDINVLIYSNVRTFILSLRSNGSGGGDK